MFGTEKLSRGGIKIRSEVLSAARRQDQGEKAHLGIYRMKGQTSRYPRFYAVAGEKSSFSKEVWIEDGIDFRSYAELISLKRVPKHWNDDIKLHIKENVDPLSAVGYLSYYLNCETAFTKNYYPRNSLNSGRALGLPYFIEAIVTRKLIKAGIREFSTSEAPSPPRIHQLRRVELSLYGATPAKRWLQGMGKGIRQTTEMSVFKPALLVLFDGGRASLSFAF